MLLGAHVPTGGRLPRAIDAALERGCRSLQIFASNPRGWAPPNHPADDLERFAERRAEAGLGPAFVHSSYLVNIASPDPAFLSRSVDLARREMAAAAAMGADGLVVHAGAAGPGERGPGLERAATSARAIAAEGPDLLLELTAGGGGTVASTLPQAAELLDACGDHPRIGLVVDTCHLFAAGAPLDTTEGVRASFAELRRLRLSPRLRLIHANDARDPRGSRRDRHDHIGEGWIGDEGFRAILTEPVVRRLPVIIETPGRTEEDRRNLARLRALGGLRGAP